MIVSGDAEAKVAGDVLTLRLLFNLVTKDQKNVAMLAVKKIQLRGPVADVSVGRLQKQFEQIAGEHFIPGMANMLDFQANRNTLNQLRQREAAPPDLTTHEQYVFGELKARASDGLSAGVHQMKMTRAVAPGIDKMNFKFAMIYPE